MATPAIVVKSICGVSGVGVGVSVGVGEGVMEGVGVGEAVGVGVGVGVGAGFSGASELGAVRKGVKITVPKLKSSSESKISSLIVCVSFVPHQL